MKGLMKRLSINTYELVAYCLFTLPFIVWLICIWIEYWTIGTIFGHIS